MDEGIRVLRIDSRWDDAPHRNFLGRLEELVSSAPPESYLHRGRNRIVRIDGPSGEPLAVKRYPARGGIRGRLRSLRESKAARAFDSARRLTELGIDTPAPFAAAELRAGDRTRATFFVSELLAPARVAKELKDPAAPGRERLLRGIGAMVGRLHASGVLHHDLTAGNVLVVEVGDGERFHLVDVNRMSFAGRPIGLGRALANLVQLRFGDGREILEGYCSARDLPFDRIWPRYRRRLALRAFAQDLREASRPLRRRFGI